MVISATFATLKGRMAEWLGTGLQNPLHRFESGSDLCFFLKLYPYSKLGIESYVFGNRHLAGRSCYYLYLRSLSIKRFSR